MKNNKKRDIKIGDVFNNLTVIEEPFYDNGYRKVKVKCKCGKELIKYSCNITKSNSCFQCSTIRYRKFYKGEKINNWEFIEYVGRIEKESNVIKAKCGYCDSIKEMQSSNLHWAKSCGCLSNREYKDSPTYKGAKYVTRSYFSQIRANAKKRNRKFNLSIEYIDNLFEKQKFKCAVSGLAIYFKNSRDLTASLDRIDSTKDYIEGNVQWVHKDVNRLKSDWNLKEFINICNMISDYNK